MMYVDDLAIAGKDPNDIITKLREVYKLELKGIDPISYHLGCDDFVPSEIDNKLCYGPKKYIQNMCEKLEQMFGEKPKEYPSPLEQNNHPELDTSEILEQVGIKQFLWSV